MDRGLSHPAVFCTLQDTDGFMWFGTQDGLNRYDGYSFHIFRNDPQDTTSLAHNWITCFCESDSTVMWIGTKGGGLLKFNKKLGTFTRYLHPRNSKIFFPDSTINALLYAGDGSLWIGTINGLFHLNIETMSLRQVTFDISEDKKSPAVIALSQDHYKDIWVGTAGKGLFRIHHESLAEAQHYHFEFENTKDIPANTINTIYEDRNYELWVGTEGVGIIHVDRQSGDYTIHQNDIASIVSG